MTLTPQQRASRKQAEKRKSQSKFFMYLSEDEDARLNKLAAKYGSKAEATRLGWKMLERKRK